MQSRWIENDDYYEALTRIVRNTVRGGIEIEDELPDQLIEIYEDGVCEGIFKKDELFDCPNCERTYAIDYRADVCDCGCPIENQEEVVIHTTQYYEDVYPNFIESEIGTNVEDFAIKYRDDRIEDIPVSDLHPVESRKGKFLHISPYFHSEIGLMPFPGYADIFLSWSKVRELIQDPEGTTENLSNYIEDEEGNGNELIGDGGLAFDSGLSAPDFNQLSDSPWFAMYRRTSPEIANRRSREIYDMEYYDLFERLGLEALHVMFPHAIKLHGGRQGQPEPDGYLHIREPENKKTYLVESKCYSSEFSIFSEADKNRRYVNDFIDFVEPDTDCRLAGCIFIATEYDKNRTREDIGELIGRCSGDRNLDVICLNDIMMEAAVEQLRSLYRREPSSTFRIYKQSSFYYDLLDGLGIMSRTKGVDKEAFQSMILDVMKKAGNTTTELEDTISSGFEHTRGYEAFCSRVGN